MTAGGRWGQGDGPPGRPYATRVEPHGGGTGVAYAESVTASSPFEPIEPVPGSFDIRAMARGEPGVPRRFRWRERDYRVVRILPGWKEMSAPEGVPGDRYVRRHGTVVETQDGSRLRLVAERGAGRKGLRWWVRRIEACTPSAPDVPREDGDGPEDR